MKIALIALTSLLAFAGRSEATSISFSTSTRGCFNCTAADLGLTDTMSLVTFTGTTDSGVTDASGSATVNLGSFTRGNRNNTEIHQFLLEVTFLVPTGVGGSPDQFTALVTGTAGQPLDFNFPNLTQTYYFSNLVGSGSFDFLVNDLNQLTKNTTHIPASLTGQITNTQFTPTSTPTLPSIPEPTTIVLLGTGLGGVAIRRYRNR